MVACARVMRGVGSRTCFEGSVDGSDMGSE